jgi:hypothetical protein
MRITAVLPTVFGRDAMSFLEVWRSLDAGKGCENELKMKMPREESLGSLTSYIKIQGGCMEPLMSLELEK